MKFQVGDKIRALKGMHFFPTGKIVTIREVIHIHNTEEYVCIDEDGQDQLLVEEEMEPLLNKEQKDKRSVARKAK